MSEHRISFSGLQLLTDLGFKEVPVAKPYIGFTHEHSDTSLMFPPYRSNAWVAAHHFAQVRIMLDAKGLMEADDFDRLMADVPLAIPRRPDRSVGGPWQGRAAQRVNSPKKHGPAGRSSQETYQTRRAWASFVRATDVARHGTAAWTWLHAPREKTALEFRRNRMRILLPSAGGAEAVVGVTVRRGVPVTVRRADVRRLIVERPAPQETRVWPPPAGRALYPRPAGRG